MKTHNVLLLAEDNDLTRELMVNVFEHNGIKVDVAENGVIALEKASLGGYALILMDLMMPKLNGVEVIKKLAQNPPKEKNGPIYILSNLSDDTLIQNAINAGANGYLSKLDLEPQDLVEKIKEILKPKSHD